MLAAIAIYVTTPDGTQYTVKPAPTDDAEWDEDLFWDEIVSAHIAEKAWITVLDAKGRECLVNEREIIAMRRGV